MAIRFLSLFAGIGGMDLGLERAGWQCVGQVEIDPFCRRVLAKHWPDVERFEDVREVTAAIVRERCGAVDAVVGGLPCQDISIAGDGVGINGKRSGLWGEFQRIICEIRPGWAVVENVAALLNRGMGRVLGDLAACGYDAEWQSLQASDFGAPHGRERIFIVAYPNGFYGDRRGVFSGARIETAAPESTQRFSDGRRRRVIDGQGNRRIRLVPDALFCGVDDGLSARMDRFRAVGNSVAPFVAQWIGERINAALNS